MPPLSSMREACWDSHESDFCFGTASMIVCLVHHRMESQLEHNSVTAWEFQQFRGDRSLRVGRRTLVDLAKPGLEKLSAV